MPPLSLAVVRELSPDAPVAFSSRARLESNVRTLADALAVLGHCKPKVASRPVPGLTELKRMCDHVCVSLDEELLRPWRPESVRVTVEALTHIVSQLCALNRSPGRGSLPAARLQDRLAALKRMAFTGTSSTHKSSAPRGDRNVQSDSLTLAPPSLSPNIRRMDNCLRSDVHPLHAPPAAPSGRRYAEMCLTHQSMVVTLHVGVPMLHAVSASDAVFTVHAIDFAAPTASAPKHRAAAPVSLEQACEAVVVTQRVRTIVEETPTPDNRVWRLLLPRLFPLTRSITPYRVLDAVVCLQDHKLFYVTHRQTGDLTALHHHLPYASSMRQALVYSLAAQGFVQLARMHDHARYGHYNLSCDSIVFNRHGEFRLARFEHARPVGRKEGDRPLLPGRLVAPELVKHTRAPMGGIALKPKVDVFALASIVAEVAGPAPHRPNPFAVATGENEDRAHVRLAKTFKKFSSWRTDMRSQLGDSISSAAVAADRSPFGLFFAPLAQVAPDLCSLLLNDAMTESVWHRKEASLIARGVLDQCTRSHINYAGRDLLLGAMQDMDDALGLPQVQQEARAFAAWRSAT